MSMGGVMVTQIREMAEMMQRMDSWDGRKRYRIWKGARGMLACGMGWKVVPVFTMQNMCSSKCLF